MTNRLREAKFIKIGMMEEGLVDIRLFNNGMAFFIILPDVGNR
jgi:hypothetical protein